MLFIFPLIISLLMGGYSNTQKSNIIDIPTSKNISNLVSTTDYTSLVTNQTCQSYGTITQRISFDSNQHNINVRGLELDTGNIRFGSYTLPNNYGLMASQIESYRISAMMGTGWENFAPLVSGFTWCSSDMHTDAGMICRFMLPHNTPIHHIEMQFKCSSGVDPYLYYGSNDLVYGNFYNYNRIDLGSDWGTPILISDYQSLLGTGLTEVSSYNNMFTDYWFAVHFNDSSAFFECKFSLLADFDTTYNVGYQDGYNSGVVVGTRDGYSVGYSDGIAQASQYDSTALTIFTGILDVALIPVNFFLTIFNFEVFGINISGLVSSFLTISVIIIILRFLFGGKSDDK